MNPATLVSLLLVVPIMAVIGYALQRGLLNFTLGDDLLPPLLVTFGLSTISRLIPTFRRGLPN